MGRFNGIFKYGVSGTASRDPQTGFPTEPAGGFSWINGTDCQIDKQTPAKQYKGVDGSENTYQYTVFIKDLNYAGKLNIGTKIHLTFENGFEDEFTVQYVDETRKYIEIWG